MATIDGTAFDTIVVGSGPSGATVARALSLEKRRVLFEREANPYRSGEARLPRAALAPLLTAGENEIVAQLG